MAADRQSKPDAGASADDGSDADVVDFNALHAALGDLPPASSSAPALTPTVAESQGKNNAVYASARPHTIPPTRAPAVDMNAPSIVVADDPPPSVPVPVPPATPNMGGPQMTIPMGSPILHPVSPGPMAIGGPGLPPRGSHPFDPRHPVQDAVQQTMHMPGRPIAPPRRPRSPTMVVRARGPSGAKKAFVFILLLLLVVGIGLAVLVVLRPGGAGDFLLGPKTTAMPPAITAAPIPTPIPTPVPSPRGRPPGAVTAPTAPPPPTVIAPVPTPATSN